MTTALVLGGASCLWDDISAFWSTASSSELNAFAPEKPWDIVVACNDAGVEWPGQLDAWVTLHPLFFEMGKEWRKKRAAAGHPKALRYICHPEAVRGTRADRLTTPGLAASAYRFPGQDKSGSSGLFAAKVALVDLGADRAVLCGIPLTATPHFFDKEPWKQALDYQRQWRTVPKDILGRMRSMSGWTREFLGAPEWDPKEEVQHG